MIEVILTKGLPGSGKSTWAQEQVDKMPNAYKRINKDTLRAMLDNNHYSQDMEKFIVQVRDSLILKCIEAGKHVIVDDTNLASKHENHIRQLVHGKAEVIIKDFTDVPVEECIKRDLKRAVSVGESVIRKMHKQYFATKKVKQVYYPGKPHAIICDLDGTLCLLNGRSPYDASTCDHDLLNPVVAELIKDKTVILVSGREDKYRPQTLSFLEKHNIKYEGLLMRTTDDFRNDAIVKREIFDTHIAGKYNIDYVLDDRNRVVDMWRSIGLTCLQVADGDF